MFSKRCASQFVGEHPPLYKKNAQCYNIPQIFDKKSPCGGIHKENTMELKLENGRPADTTGRLEKEIRTYDFLDALQVPYQRIDHETLMTIEAVSYTHLVCIRDRYQDRDPEAGSEACR